jgi:hypothetical protein
VSDDEWNAIQEGNAQAERGEFVSDEDRAAPSSLPPLPTFDGGGQLVNIADQLLTAMLYTTRWKMTANLTGCIP